MKLFIGIELPDNIKLHIANFVQPLQANPKGWEKPHDYHMTLLFLGETPNEGIDEIINRINGISYKPFELELNSFDFFPRRVLYLALKPSAELFELNKLIEEVFPGWVRPEAKPFTPHITVKRWARYEFNFLEAGIKSRIFYPAKFKVRGLALFKSERDSENNKYHIIHSIEFKN